MSKTDYINSSWLSNAYETMSVEEIADYCQTYPSVIAICLYNFKIETKANLSEYIKF